MTDKETEKFTKLMQLTLSSNDHEALLALRRATNILLQAGYNWEDLIAQKIRVDASTSFSPPPSPQRSNTAEMSSELVEEMLNVVKDNATGTFVEFIDSLILTWEVRGKLSPAQLDALYRSYLRATRTQHV